jgi:ribosomal protein S18 acetylase RimI-like enzyme
MNPARIRELRPEDWRAFCDLRLRALHDAPDAFGSTLAEEEGFPEARWHERLTDPQAVNFVGETTEHGFVGLAVSAPYDQETGLYSMWVDPRFRQTGLGSRLVEAIIQWARGRGFAKVLLDVADNNTAAIALYRRHGFRPTGVTGTLPPPRTHIQEHQLALTLV